LSKEMKRFGKWASLCLLFIFICVCGLLIPQLAEAAVTAEQANAWGKRMSADAISSFVLKADGTIVSWGGE
jgi:hypothetical protein